MKQFANECILVMGAKTKLPYFIEAFLCWNFPKKRKAERSEANPFNFSGNEYIIGKQV
jgi:hypothetical protein